MTKIELEQLSNLTVRTGFDKHITKTLEYFNFDKIEDNEAKIIIKFINSSNIGY